ncbi:MAG TPA: signal peptidase I [Rhizomicrobium sp.]|jgi:signal peptidase I
MSNLPETSDAPVASGRVVKKKSEESWIETVKTIVYALLIAFVIRTFLFQPFNIPSGSMENTLLVGDYLFVQKFAYGYSRYSFPFGFPPFSGRVFGTGPDRGDVVVFKMPNADSPDYMKDFIKRVIGLPGDRVQMVNGQVILNGKPIPKVRVADYVTADAPCPMATDASADGLYHVPRYQETLPGGKSYFVLDCMPEGPSDNTQVYIVPPGHYFMMGDNRDNSADSRADVGYVPADNVEGRAVLLFFSIGESSVWYEPWTWPGAIRFNRILNFID